MGVTPIETARTLLASASPELRRAVGELLEAARQAGEDAFSFGTRKYWRINDEFTKFSRELIEDKGTTHGQ